MAIDVKVGEQQVPPAAPQAAPVKPGDGWVYGNPGKRSFIRRVWLPSLIAVISLGAGFGAGYYTRGDSGAEDLQAELTASRAESESAQEALEIAEGEIDAATQRAETAEGELVSREAELSSLEADLIAREQELEQREGQVQAAEQAVERNSFGDGLYKVGEDIQPGTYRTDGANNCYWAKLGSSNTSDFIDNHFGNGPQTLVIDSPWFESSGCGTWVLSG